MEEKEDGFYGYLEVESYSHPQEEQEQTTPPLTPDKRDVFLTPIRPEKYRLFNMKILCLRYLLSPCFARKLKGEKEDKVG